MTRTTLPPRTGRTAAAADSLLLVDALGDQRYLLDRISWESYVAINDAIVERPVVRMAYRRERLTVSTLSLWHFRCSSALYQLVVELAAALRVRWETGGSATYRSPKKRVGVEGDQAFYFGEHAVQMKGPQEIDLAVQPPPDLAIQVEVNRSADNAVNAWGRLGVPEVWRYDAVARECSFWSRRRNGAFGRIDRGLAFPVVAADDVSGQMQSVDQLISSDWHVKIQRWVRNVVVPRKRKGG